MGNELLALQKCLDFLRSCLAMRKAWDAAEHPRGKGGRFASKGGKTAKAKFDRQGNPLTAGGKLKVERASVAELTDGDFTAPTRSVILPSVSEGLRKIVGEKPFVIKKSVFEKNARNHPELSAADGREILRAALYETEIAGQSQPKSKPNYILAIKTTDTANSVCLFEVSERKTHNEIVGWRKINGHGLKKIERQAVREDGQLLILSKDAADALSAFPHGNTVIMPQNQNSVKQNRRDFLKKSLAELSDVLSECGGVVAALAAARQGRL